MRNVTITLPEEVATWARVQAAKRDTSLSRMLGNILLERMEAEKGYSAAMAGYFERKPSTLKKNEVKYPTRDSLHER